MTHIYIINIILLVILTVYTVGNNASILREPSIYVGLLKSDFAKTILVASIFLGFIIEGVKLRHGIRTSFNITGFETDILLCILVIHVLIYNHLGIPYSLTQGIIGGYIGLSLYFLRSININYLVITILLWITYPLLNILLSYILAKIFRSLGYESRLRLRYLSFLGMVILGYVYGSNTIGTISSLSTSEPSLLPILIGPAIILGILYTGAKTGEYIGGRIYGLHVSSYIASIYSTIILIELATQLSVPVPLSSLLTLGYFGPIFTYDVKIFRPNRILRIFKYWVFNPISTLSITYVVLFFIDNFPKIITI